MADIQSPSVSKSNSWFIKKFTRKKVNGPTGSPNHNKSYTSVNDYTKPFVVEFFLTIEQAYITQDDHKEHVEANYLTIKPGHQFVK
jgi:hypothetical protein